ncbi:FAD-dependent oxidoreductase [Spongiactinospora sp. 9N601]|uniref:FAD-dependent oxidoreductase n=1 Tax=Spongiactinospora sp. 9N601 TaxID=3375149 RepID=UPI0037994719
MADSPVLVVGAGPAGLMTAAELALAGVPVTVLERHPRHPGHSRGFNLNPYSLEVLDRRGIAGRFLAEGPTVPHMMFADPRLLLDLTAMAAGHRHVLGIAQARVEELLAEWAAELGVRIMRGHEVTGLEQDAGGVTVTARTPEGERKIRAGYVAGCDGSRSAVRKLAGIGFPGTPATRYTILADAEPMVEGDLSLGVTTGPGGAVLVIPRPGYVRIVVKDPAPPEERDEPVTAEYFQAALDQTLGRHVPLGPPRWLSRFGDAARLADRFVAGRVVLAGDAAHIHPPAGALGVNVALADAVNLGWKLAATVQGHAPAGLLASYHTERHASGAAVLRYTQAQALLGGDEERLAPLRELVTELTALAPVNRYLAEAVTGIGTRYAMPPAPGRAADPEGEDHPWLGRLAPDLKLTGPDGAATGLAALLRAGRGVLVDCAGGAFAAEAAGLRGRVDVLSARCEDDPGLAGLLVRPDGHTAWVSTRRDPRPAATLRHALTTWFGSPESKISACETPCR